MGLFSRLKEGLTKTRDTLVQRVTTIVTGRAIDESLFQELEDTLLQSDVGFSTSEELINRLRKRAKQNKLTESEQLSGALKEELRAILIENQPGIEDNNSPHVILIVGVNGVGKTTTIGKLANNFKVDGKKVIIGAADTYRAAANTQLDIWAKRAGVGIIGAASGGTLDPAAVAFDTVQHAVAQKADIVIIDTAGRLHTKVNLMDELSKIGRVMQKVIPTAPHEVLLVLDATTGQNAIQQAKQFGNAVGVTGLVVTKLDGTAKGGVVFAIAHELHLPVRYIGVGEQIDDLQPFDAAQFVEALFGS